MGAAYVDSDGNVVQLDSGGGPPEVVRPEDVADDTKLARMVERILKSIAQLERRWDPEKRWFRDVTVDATGTTKYRLEHGLGGRVNWYVAHWDGAAGVEVRVDQHADTDSDTLVLVSGAAGTVTILVEEAG
jgi:hypothetical protein